MRRVFHGNGVKGGNGTDGVGTMGRAEFEQVVTDSTGRRMLIVAAELPRDPSREIYETIARMAAALSPELSPKLPPNRPHSINPTRNRPTKNRVS